MIFYLPLISVLDFPSNVLSVSFPLIFVVYVQLVVSAYISIIKVNTLIITCHLNSYLMNMFNNGGRLNGF